MTTGALAFPVIAVTGAVENPWDGDPNRKTAAFGCRSARCRKWWARLGLNQRPPPCEDGALPLSYAPEIKPGPYKARLEIVSRKPLQRSAKFVKPGDDHVGAELFRRNDGVSTGTQNDGHSRGPGGTNVVGVVTDEHRILGVGFQRVEYGKDQTRIRFAHTVEGVAAENGGEGPIESEIAEDLSCRRFRFVGADAKCDSVGNEPRESLRHTGIRAGLDRCFAFVVGEKCRGHCGQIVAGHITCRGEGAFDEFRGTIADHRRDLGKRQRPATVLGEEAIEGRPEVRRAVDEGAVEIENDRSDSPHCLPLSGNVRQQSLTWRDSGPVARFPALNWPEKAF